MKRFQRGEAMLAVMVVMLVVVWLGRGPMGMTGMGHGPDAAHKSGQAEQATKAEPPPASVPKKAAEHEH